MVRTLSLTLVVSLALFTVAPEALANEPDRARQECKEKITEVYGLKKFQNAHIEKTGNRVGGCIRVRHFIVAGIE